MDYTSFSSFHGNSHFELEPPGAAFLYTKGDTKKTKVIQNGAYNPKNRQIPEVPVCGLYIDGIKIPDKQLQWIVHVD